jgi:glycine/D-amino acid oxidase-like deaminating enzyme
MSRLGSPNTTCQVDPYKFTNALAEKACKNGSKVIIDSCKALQRENGKITGVILGSGVILKCDKLIVALGPWSSLLKDCLKVPNITYKRAHSIIMTTSNCIPAQVLFTQGDNNEMDPEIVPRPDGNLGLIF